MRKIFALLGAVIIAAVLLCAGVLWYVRPEEKLDLSYSEVSLSGIWSGIGKTSPLKVRLTEREVNDLLKKYVSANRKLSERAEIAGVRFRLLPDMLAADADVLYAGKVHIGTTSYYSLAWNNPDMTATYLYTEVKGFRFPPGWLRLDSFRIPVGDRLPPFLRIKNVTFGHGYIEFELALKRLLP